MNTNGKKRDSKTPKNIRFPNDLLVWVQRHAKERGISSDVELIRQIVHEYRQRAEQNKAAAA